MNMNQTNIKYFSQFFGCPTWKLEGLCKVSSSFEWHAESGWFFDRKGLIRAKLTIGHFYWYWPIIIVKKDLHGSSHTDVVVWSLNTIAKKDRKHFGFTVQEIHKSLDSVSFLWKSQFLLLNFNRPIEVY